LEDATASGTDEVSGILRDESQGTVEVVIDVVADDYGDAWTKAHAIYARLRAVAGLSPVLEADGWVSPPPEVEHSEPRHDTLFASAKTLLDDGQHALAVIVAQTACEVYMARAIRDLLRRHIRRPALRWWVPGVVSSYSMRSDSRTQELWEALTATKIQQQKEWWDDYCEHVRRRNRVVHEGAHVPPAEAKKSVDSAGAFISFVRDASRHAPPADEGF
jgi:hypothetical protein